ncbi:N-methyl-L-tryptophan oxidase [Arthrobacter cupressi]|uniref:Sarcosine oxidase n=1 Tax=Arthrobacter cupressi TaxID=1045773 RepID=A0A1G8RCB4_9MICC|nr:N-methyl-L-tryptophan oxidase [Arthrobacter cupressi]NYD77796.1 sarcosine oxidase [Arthrobacter cupressi]SDJ14010.1 sarcosine oxidase [Arthrobacter cupressi]
MTALEADVVIVGVGSVGSLASWQLASRGLRVIGIDRFSIPGPFSAYAGESRIFRKVYAEGGHYTPVLQRSQDLWRELEKISGTQLLNATGAVTIYDEHNARLASLLAAGRDNGLDYDLLRGEEARAKYPEHSIRDTDVTIFDPEGGYLKSEKAVTAALAEAKRLGATFLGNRKAQSVEKYGDRYIVRTDQEEIIASRVVVSQGNGAGAVCKELGVHLAIRPQVLTWFPAVDPSSFLREDMPVFVRRAEEEGRSDKAQFYGFPSADGWTMKVVGSVYMDDVQSMEKPPTWAPEFLEPIRAWVREFIPGLIPDPVRVATCADGHLPDQTALFGRVPGMEGVIVAAGFSGHGFKMASAMGAIAADLLLEGTTATDVSFMNPARFLGPDTRLTSLALS